MALYVLLNLESHSEGFTNLPPIQNGHGALWNKVSIVFVIFRRGMGHSELVHRSPSLCGRRFSRGLNLIYRG